MIPFPGGLLLPLQGDLKLGKKLGSGAFGQVYKAQLAPETPGGEATPVIVKKARRGARAAARCSLGQGRPPTARELPGSPPR